MAANEIVHSGKTSWWDGTFRTSCGEVWPRAVVKQSKWKFFGPATCPGCLAVRRRNER